MDQDALLQELRAVFAEELREELARLAEDLAALARRPHDAELAKSTHRRAHGLKGAARSVGEKAIEEACWDVEQRLRPVRDGAADVTEELLDDAQAGLARIARAAAPLLGTPIPAPAPAPRRSAAKLESKPARQATPAPASLPNLPTLNLPSWDQTTPAQRRPPTPAPKVPRPASPRPASPLPAAAERSPLDVFRSAMDGALRIPFPPDDAPPERPPLDVFRSAMDGALRIPVSPATPPADAAPPERPALDIFRSALDGALRIPMSPTPADPTLPSLAEPVAEMLPEEPEEHPYHEAAEPNGAVAPLDLGASMLDHNPFSTAWASAMPAAHGPDSYGGSGLSDELAAQLRQVFLDELDDHLTDLATNLDELAAAPERADLVANLFRAAHSLKGAARSTGERGIEAVGHRFEDVLSDIRSGHRAATPEAIGTMRAAVAELSAAGQRLRANAGDASELFAVAERLEELPGQAPATAAPAPAAPADPAESQRHPVAPQASVRVASERLDGLLARSDELVGLPRRMDDRVEECDALRALLRQGRALPPGDAAARDGWLRRLEGELATHAERLAEDRQRLGARCDAIRKEAHALRMQPFADACRTLEAAAREIARASGKDIAVELRGQDTMFDRAALEGLKDPLLHLVRNAADHGLETPARRRAAGKPARGTIVVDAALHGDRMSVTVADDGGGLDLDGLRRRLRRDGQAVPDDEQELARTIFQPGLTTRERVTAFSGRGVGLDVVKARVEALGGAVDVDFQPGAGSTFALALPANLTTRRAVLLRIGEQVVAAPSQHLERLFRVDPDSLFSENGRECVRMGNAVLPLASLSAALRFESPPRLRDGKLLIAVAKAGERRLGLCIDEALGEQELVVKRLSPRLRRARLLEGAATLPAGGLCLVLNVAETLRAAAESQPGLLAALVRAERGRRERRRVLVADDSITTRTLVKSRLEAAGHVVIPAGDGEEAWRLLEERGADLLLSDIDMPALDGFQLVERVRAAPKWRNLPVVLLSSRDTPADRARGAAVGADEYLVKSGFDQREALAMVARLLRRGKPSAPARSAS